jgi:hypothetical protein
MHESEFSAADGRTLTSLLDLIVPPSRDGRLPGAGELGISVYVLEALEAAPDQRSAIAQGLSGLHEAAQRRGEADFAALSEAHRLEVVQGVAQTQPGLLPLLIFHTYAGYYQNARVVETLGLEARPPHPDGYALETGDLTLLDPVRERGDLQRS